MGGHSPSSSKNGIVRRLVLLTVVSSLSVFAGSLLAPVESRFIYSLCGDTRIVGLIFSAGTILSFLFSVLIGRKSLKWGKKRTTLLGMLVGIVYPLIYATSTNAFQYLVGRVGWAFAATTTGMLINAIFQDTVKSRKNIAESFGYRFSAQSIAGSVGSFLGGYIGDTYGLRAPYFLLPFVYAFMLILTIYTLRDYTERKIVKESRHSITSSLRNIMYNPFLFFRFFTEGITQSHWAMEPIVFPFAIYAITSSNTATGIVFSLMGLIAMFALPLTGRFVDRYSAIVGLKVAFLLYVLAFTIMSSAHSLSVFIVGALLLSLGKTFNGPSVARIETLHIRDEVRAEYLGYFQAYDTVTGACAAFITGVLLRYLSPWQVLFGYGVFTLAGFIVGYVLFLRKLRRWKGDKVS